ncbi:hypothetical protein [Demequina sp.]|uniref:hypothetical protein n=1 Tax=Demequina sp. TaxID=2050685 RepID=UPI003D13758F
MNVALRIAAVLAVVNTALFMSEAADEGPNPGLITLTVVGAVGVVLCFMPAPLWAKGVGAIALAVAPGYFYPLNAVFLVLGVVAIAMGVRQRRRTERVNRGTTAPSSP